MQRQRRSSDLSIAFASFALALAAAGGVGVTALSAHTTPILAGDGIAQPAFLVPTSTAASSPVAWSDTSTAPSPLQQATALPASAAPPVPVRASAVRDLTSAAPRTTTAAAAPTHRTTPNGAAVTKKPSPLVSPRPSPLAVTAVPPAPVAVPAAAWPGPTNTGTHGTLTPSGSLTISSSGTYSNLAVHGHIDVTAPNVTLTNVRVDAADAPYAIRNLSSGHLTITDCDLGPSAPGSVTDAAVVYSNYTLLRCNVHDTEDGLKAQGNTTIEDSWIHDTFEDNGNHSDGIQVSAGSNVLIQHNTIQQFPKDTTGAVHQGVSCVIVKSDQGPINGVQILDNDLSGYVGFLLYDRAGSNYPTPTGVVIAGNTFGPKDPPGQATGYVYGTLSADASGPSLQDNVDS